MRGVLAALTLAASRRVHARDSDTSLSSILEEEVLEQQRGGAHEHGHTLTHGHPEDVGKQKVAENQKKASRGPRGGPGEAGKPGDAAKAGPTETAAARPLLPAAAAPRRRDAARSVPSSPRSGPEEKAERGATTRPGAAPVPPERVAAAAAPRGSSPPRPERARVDRVGGSGREEEKAGRGAARPDATSLPSDTRKGEQGPRDTFGYKRTGEHPLPSAAPASDAHPPSKVVRRTDADRARAKRDREADEKQKRGAPVVAKDETKAKAQRRPMLIASSPAMESGVIMAKLPPHRKAEAAHVTQAELQKLRTRVLLVSVTVPAVLVLLVCARLRSSKRGYGVASRPAPAPTGGMRTLPSVVLSVVVVALSSVLILLNQQIQRRTGLSALALTWGQALSASTLAFAAFAIGGEALCPMSWKLAHRPLDSVMRLFPLAMTTAGSIWFSNRAIGYCSIPFIQFCKQTNIFWVFLVATIFGLRKPSKCGACAVFVVLVGAIFAIKGEVSVSLPGIRWQIGAQGCDVARVTLLAAYLHKDGGLKLDPVTLALVVSPLSCFVLGVTLSRTLDEADALALNGEIRELLLACVLAAGHNLAIATLIQQVSSVSYSFVGVAKNVTLVVSSFLLGATISHRQWVGYALMLCGVFLHRFEDLLDTVLDRSWSAADAAWKAIVEKESAPEEEEEEERRASASSQTDEPVDQDDWSTTTNVDGDERRLGLSGGRRASLRPGPAPVVEERPLPTFSKPQRVPKRTPAGRGGGSAPLPDEADRGGEADRAALPADAAAGI